MALVVLLTTNKRHHCPWSRIWRACRSVWSVTVKATLSTIANEPKITYHNQEEYRPRSWRPGGTSGAELGLGLSEKSLLTESHDSECTNVINTAILLCIFGTKTRVSFKKYQSRTTKTDFFGRFAAELINFQWPLTDLALNWSPTLSPSSDGVRRSVLVQTNLVTWW